MMKLRMIRGLLICVLLASMTLISARADVIFEPRDDFYEQKSEDCVYINRYCMANGPSGAVDILKEPGSDKIVTSINNGNEFYVSFTYTDTNGVVWGVVEFKPDDSGNLGKYDYSKMISGWIRMSDMKLNDYVSFAEDHQNEFKPYTGGYDEFRDSKALVFWRYPNSGVIAWEDDTPEIGDMFIISQTFTDPENRQWGFVDYYYGVRNVWICISDPAGAGIESVAAPEPSVIKTPAASTSYVPVTQSGQPSPLSDATVPTVQKDQTPMLLLIALIVAVVVVVTGIIIAVFWKKNMKDGAVK